MVRMFASSLPSHFVSIMDQSGSFWMSKSSQLRKKLVSFHGKNNCLSFKIKLLQTFLQLAEKIQTINSTFLVCTKRVFGEPEFIKRNDLTKTKKHLYRIWLLIAARPTLGDQRQLDLGNGLPDTKMPS